MSLSTIIYRLLLVMLLTTSSVIGVFGQDVWLQSHSLPVSGCSKTSSEIVQVSILNNSATPMVFNTITASYTIDGGPVTSQLIGTTLGANASINLAFNVNADLSACGPHNVKVWVQRAGDMNQLNDTLTWVVQNDCPVIPGTVLSDANVCNNNNSGVLSLSGWTYGTIIDWQTSTNGGSTWNSTGISTSTYNYLNINQTTQYQVFIDGGFCPDAYSAIATLTPVPAPTQGTMSGEDSLCITNANGSVSISGTSNSILSWESSTDNGASWNPIANTSYSNSYTGLTSTTLFRALIDGNGCPDIYSDTAEIYIDTQSDPGTVIGSDSLCATNGNGALVVSGNIGPVDFWEYSTDGINWLTIASNSTILTYNSLTQTTYYRAHTVGQICPSHFSDTATIYIQPIPTPPDLIGGDSLCITSVNGTVELVTPPSPILQWEYSDNAGSSWNTIANTMNTEAFSGLTTTRLYRTLLDGGFCADYYSNPTTVYVEPLTNPGTITGPDSLCITNATGTLVINGTIGNVDYWESSTNNGTTWNPIASTSSNYSFPALLQTTWFRAYTNGGFCPSYFTDTAIVFIEDEVIGGSLSGSDVFCNEAISGQIDLLGNNNTILDWEYSTNNGATWNSLGTTAASSNYSNVLTTTLYRVLIHGAICPDAYSDTATIQIDAFSDAGILMSDTTACAGSSYTFQLTGNNATPNWENSIDGSTWSSNSNASGASYTISNAQVTEYNQVIVTNGVCPPDTSNVAIITINLLPTVTVSNDTTITEGDSVLVIGTGGVVGIWLPNTMITDNSIPNPTVFPLTTQYYSYNVIGANGCIASDSVLITVNPPTTLDIKNVITANGDSYNDFWIIEGVENYPNTEVHVFNIYGNEVFSDENYSNDWEATYNGKQLPNGTYFYIVKLSETQEEFKGSLTILGDE